MTHISRKRQMEQLEDYIIRGINLYDRTPALQERFSSPNSPEYLKYIDVEAILYFREIQEVGIPLPFWQDMLTVGGETDLRLFLNIGYECFSSIRKHLPRDVRTQIKVLDFGVGCARTMRFFFRELKEFECYGCDVDQSAISYLMEFVPFIQATTSNNLPPLPYPTAYFDSIYSISVFTHLSSDAFKIWLDELSRVLKPDGILQLSLHGKQAFQHLENDQDRRSLIGIREEEFHESKSQFSENGFMWINQPVGSEDIDTRQFGISFLSREALEQFHSKNFNLLEYLEGEIGDWQDLAVLQRKDLE